MKPIVARVVWLTGTLALAAAAPTFGCSNDSAVVEQIPPKDAGGAVDTGVVGGMQKTADRGSRPCRPLADESYSVRYLNVA